MRARVSPALSSFILAQADTRYVYLVCANATLVGHRGGLFVILPCAALVYGRVALLALVVVVVVVIEDLLAANAFLTDVIGGLGWGGVAGEEFDILLALLLPTLARRDPAHY